MHQWYRIRLYGEDEEIVFSGQSQWGSMRVSWAINMLIWHCIDEERDDESFMRVEIVSWG